MSVEATPGTALATEEPLGLRFARSLAQGGSSIVLQLLDLAKENAALKSELARLRHERAALEDFLARVLQILAETACRSDDGRPDR